MSEPRRCRVCGAMLNPGDRHKHEVAGWKPRYDDFEGALEGYEVAASPSPPEPPTPCPACGGSGDRNGNLRASDPFGTCPGCDGTGVQDRDAAHQFPTQHGFAVTVARALESAAEAVRRERLRIVDLIGSEFPDSMPLLAGDVIGMLQADFLDRAERSEHDDRD